MLYEPALLGARGRFRVARLPEGVAVLLAVVRDAPQRAEGYRSAALPLRPQLRLSRRAQRPCPAAYRWAPEGGLCGALLCPIFCLASPSETLGKDPWGLSS